MSLPTRELLVEIPDGVSDSSDSDLSIDEPPQYIVTSDTLNFTDQRALKQIFELWDQPNGPHKFDQDAFTNATSTLKLGNDFLWLTVCQQLGSLKLQFPEKSWLELWSEYGMELHGETDATRKYAAFMLMEKQRTLQGLLDVSSNAYGLMEICFHFERRRLGPLLIRDFTEKTNEFMMNKLQLFEKRVFPLVRKAVTGEVLSKLKRTSEVLRAQRELCLSQKRRTFQIWRFALKSQLLRQEYTKGSCLSMVFTSRSLAQKRKLQCEALEKKFLLRSKILKVKQACKMDQALNSKANRAFKRSVIVHIKAMKDLTEIYQRVQVQLKRRAAKSLIASMRSTLKLREDAHELEKLHLLKEVRGALTLVWRCKVLNDAFILEHFRVKLQFWRLRSRLELFLRTERHLMYGLIRHEFEQRRDYALRVLRTYKRVTVVAHNRPCAQKAIVRLHDTVALLSKYDQAAKELREDFQILALLSRIHTWHARICDMDEKATDLARSHTLRVSVARWRKTYQIRREAMYTVYAEGVICCLKGDSKRSAINHWQSRVARISKCAQEIRKSQVISIWKLFKTQIALNDELNLQAIETQQKLAIQSVLSMFNQSMRLVLSKAAAAQEFRAYAVEYEKIEVLRNWYIRMKRQRLRAEVAEREATETKTRNARDKCKQIFRKWHVEAMLKSSKLSIPQTPTTARNLPFSTVLRIQSQSSRPNSAHDRASMPGTPTKPYRNIFEGN